MLNELEPQVKALLDQFRTDTARVPAPDHVLSPREKIELARQRVRTLSTTLGLGPEPVFRTEDLIIPRPGGKVVVRLYVATDIAFGS